MFGYDVFLGEALLTIAVIALVTLLCVKSREAVSRLMVVMAVIFTLGITACFAVAMLRHGGTEFRFTPGFIPEKSALRQIVHIAFISPWAFIGFEGVSHFAGEYHFKTSRLFRILTVALITTTLLYIFVFLLSITAYPAGCASWPPR